LLGSFDGITFTKLHEVTNGAEWSTGEEERSHLLHVNAHFRFFRLQVNDVPGRMTGNKYTVIRNLRFTAPTGAPPHTSIQTHKQCLVTIVIPNLIRNRRFEGFTKPFMVKTYDSMGVVIDEKLQADGAHILPALLKNAAVVPSSTLAGEIVTMRVSFTPMNEIPPEGHIEVVFPDGIDLSMMPLQSSIIGGPTDEANVFESSLPNCGRVVLRLTGQAVQIVRDNNCTVIPANKPFSLLLTKVRNMAFPGIGGAYIIRTKAHDSLIDHDESVAPTNFTTNNFANVSLELPSDVAGAMGIVRLTFVPSNPIPPDGRLHLQMPDEYVLTQPVHADWREGADGFLSTTVEPDGSILMTREGKYEAPRGVKLVIEIHTVTNVPRSGDALTFEMCSQLNDGRRIDCIAPMCTGCEAEVTHITPRVMRPAQLIGASVVPELPVTGHEGLVVRFMSVNAYAEGSILQFVIPSKFRVEGAYWSAMSTQCADCYERYNPPNNTAAPMPQVCAINISVAGEMQASTTNVTTLTMTLPKLPRGAVLQMNVRGVRNPICRGPTGKFQLMVRTPGMVVIDQDLDIQAVNISHGYLSPSSISADTNVAGDMIEQLTVKFSSHNNPIPARGYVEITLPPSFYACPCKLVDTSGIPGAEPVRCQEGVGCMPGNEIRPFFRLALGSGSPQRYQSDLNYTAVESKRNGTVLRLQLKETVARGDFEFQLVNIRGQNFSGPTGTFMIQTFCPDGVLIDENLAVPGYTMVTSRKLEGTFVTVMDSGAGSRGRLLVEFVPYNPLPPGSMIALVLAAGFQVLANASVAQPVGNAASDPDYYIQEWDTGVALDGDLEVQVHNDVLVTISRKASTVSTPPGTRVAFFLDMVRNPQRSGKTGTFQLRTLLSTGAPIDENLAVPGVMIAPGNFTGMCPPYCSKPEVKPTSLLAGSMVNISVAFYTTNPLPSDGQIEVQLHENASVVGKVVATAGSVLDGSRETPEQVGPVLDGKLMVFLHGRTVRVRRDGTGRRIEAGEMVSLTIEGIQNPDIEGNTGVAHIWTKQSDGIVIDESEIPGHVMVPVEFRDFELVKDVLTAGVLSTITISLSTSGPMKVGSKLIVDFSNETMGSTGILPLDHPANSLGLDPASSDWVLSIEDGFRLVLQYQGAEAIPGGNPTVIAVSNVPNPSVASSIVYLMSLLAPGSADPTVVEFSFEYEVGGLTEVAMEPTSYLAGFKGEFSVRFKVLNPLPGDSIIDIELPHTFAFTDTVTAFPEIPSEDGISILDGILEVTRTSETEVSLQRLLGSTVPAGGIVEILLFDVRNQGFSGLTPRLTVTTRTSERVLIDTGKSEPIILDVSALSSSSVTFETGVAGAVEKAIVNLRIGSPIPHDGLLLIQFPAGTQVLDPPEYMAFMDHPVRVTVYPGTPASLDVRLYNGQAPAAPYFDFNSTHALAPLPVDVGVLRGPSVLLSRLGGASIPAASNVNFAIPGVKVTPWSGFSGMFQVMTMLRTFELIDQDREVNGVMLKSGVLRDVAIEASSLVSGATVQVTINMTLSVSLPPTSEIHVTFPAGYRTVEYATIVAKEGLVGKVQAIGAVPVAAGGTVLKLKHNASTVTPEGTNIYLVLGGVQNRFFSSRSQYFQLDIYRADGTTRIEKSPGIVVPSECNSAGGAPGFGVVVESDRVVIFDAHDPSQAVGNFTLEEGTGSVTHGVSALDREGDMVYFIAGGKLLSLELAYPSVVSVPLNTGADNILGFVSMEWDSARQRLVGLALVDGELMLASVEPVSGNVSRISDLSSCGTCECSPSQGVSALDTERGVYYMASQVTVTAINSSTGAIVSQASVVQGEDGFFGFASLEYDGQGHAPRFIPMGLLGVALRGDTVELVHIDTNSGAMKTIAKIFDEVFTGQIVGGISALTPDHAHYMLLSQARLLAVDLASGVVSHYSPYAFGASGAWAFLEMSCFLKPLQDHVAAQTGRRSANVVPPPVDLAELNITVVGVEESTPIKRGSVASGNYFAIRLTGSDIAPGDRVQISASGDCGTVLPGGGPFEIVSHGMHLQRFYLELDGEPGYAQLCYSRPDGFGAAFRSLPYGVAQGAMLVDFPTTMAYFSVSHAPIPLGTAVSLTLSGALSAGDLFRIVMDDGTVNPADLCLRAPLYPGTEPVAVVSIDPMQIRTYAFGAVTEIVSDLLLESAGGAKLAICYQPISSSSFALIRGRQRASAADQWLHKTLISVAQFDSSNETSTCAAGFAPQL
jgi:hypothetical protein